MKTHLTRAGAGLVAAALACSALLATSPAAHAADGALTLSIVDQYGRPTPGIVQVYDSSTGNEEGGSVAVASTQTIPLSPGGYSLIVITPWSGITCDGLAPCGSTTPGATGYTTVVTIPDGGTVSYTTHVTVPSISGGSEIGSPLTLTVPDGIKLLSQLLSSVPAFAGLPTQQWVRGATDVSGATGLTYTTTRDDGGQPISVRMTPSAGTTFLFSTAGSTAPLFTTNSVTPATFAKVKTKTTVKVPKNLAVGQRASATVKVKGKDKDAGKATGTVTVRIGTLKIKKKLKDGGAFITLPRLGAGSYTISVKYAGSADFVKSSGKAKFSVHS